MPLSWAAEVVGRLRNINRSMGDLADEANVTRSWLSVVINGKRGQGDKTKQRINEALERLERRCANADG